MFSEWTITWDCGEATIQSSGAMLAPVAFHLPDGRTIQPFVVGDWADDHSPEYIALPPMLRRLRGEWPCVPFGIDSQPSLPLAWTGIDGMAGDGWPHGYGANHDWELVERDALSVTLAVSYPAKHPIRGLRRRVRAISGAAALAITLEIEAREVCEISLALHPVFRLPETEGLSELVVEGAAGGRTHPRIVDPTSRLRPDSAFADLRAVPTRNGGPIDLTTLPPGVASEDIVQVVAAGGHVTLHNHEERYSVVMAYDAAVFPTLVLWLANRGLQSYPWNGAFRALGVEPARAAFDLGLAASIDTENPWRRSGVPTSLALAAGEVFSTSYTIGVEPL